MRAIQVAEERGADQTYGVLLALLNVFCFVLFFLSWEMEKIDLELHAKHHLKFNTDAGCRPVFICDLWIMSP